MDLRRLRAALRAVRQHKGWRQQDVARAAGISRSTAARAESQAIGTVPAATLGKIATALGMAVDVIPRWRGSDLDRLLNAGHSAMHEQMAEIIGRADGWQFQPEVSFSIYGERGVIDILAFHPATGALLVIELKTEIIDVQALIGTVDRYRRLAPRIAGQAGWKAQHVSVWVIVRETATNRRRVTAHASVLRAAFPVDGRSMSGWLRHPAAAIRALSFLPSNTATRRSSVRRVRSARPDANVPTR